MKNVAIVPSSPVEHYDVVIGGQRFALEYVVAVMDEIYGGGGIRYNSPHQEVVYALDEAAGGDGDESAFREGVNWYYPRAAFYELRAALGGIRTEPSSEGRWSVDLAGLQGPRGGNVVLDLSDYAALPPTVATVVSRAAARLGMHPLEAHYVEAGPYEPAVVGGHREAVPVTTSGGMEGTLWITLVEVD